MEPIHPNEIRTGAGYEAERPAARGAVTALRRERRIGLGDRIGVVFENRATLAAVVEEQLRAERAEHPEAVTAEVAAANALLPGAGELAASVHLHASDAAELSALTSDLDGWVEAIRLETGGEAVCATARGIAGEPGGDPAALVVFTLSPQQREALHGGDEVTLAVDHRGYSASVVLPAALREALAAELG